MLSLMLSVRKIPCVLFTLLLFLSLQFSLIIFVDSHVIKEEVLTRFAHGDTITSDSINVDYKRRSDRLRIIDDSVDNIVNDRVKRKAKYDWQKNDDSHEDNDNRKGNLEIKSSTVKKLKTTTIIASKSAPYINDRRNNNNINNNNNNSERKQLIQNDDDSYKHENHNNIRHIDREQSDIKAILWSNDHEFTSNTPLNDPPLELKKVSSINNSNNLSGGKILSKNTLPLPLPSSSSSSSSSSSPVVQSIDNTNEDRSLLKYQQISKKINLNSTSSFPVLEAPITTTAPSKAHLDYVIDGNKAIQSRTYWESMLSVSEDKLRAYTLSEDQRYGHGRAKPRHITEQLSKAKIFEYNSEEEQNEQQQHHHHLSSYHKR